LENSDIGSCGLRYFSEAIYDTEIAIEARNKAKLVRDLTAPEIEEELRPRGCSLELLNLSKNSFQITQPADCLALERLVALTPTIVELNLSCCNLGVPAGEALGKGLRNHPTLTSLNLSRNRLEEYGVKKLCKGLHENSVLKNLDLARNSMSGRGASGVAQLLSNTNCGIETLSLYGNFIGIEGARFIATSLEKNSTLTDLDIGLNRMRPKGVNAIANALKKNSTLKVLRLKQNFINDKAAMELGEVLVEQSSVTRLVLQAIKSRMRF
jgi:Ran GTPase-activating protein (RanGAP) involved in mRNA processing and transport